MGNKEKTLEYIKFNWYNDIVAGDSLNRKTVFTDSGATPETCAIRQYSNVLSFLFLIFRIFNKERWYREKLKHKAKKVC